MIICIWVVLWDDEETELGDILIVVLGIFFLALSYNSLMPKISYIKFMDVLFLICFLFAFLSLCKLSLMKCLRKRWEKKHKDSDLKWSEEMRGASLRIKTENRRFANRKFFLCVRCFHISTQLLIPIVCIGLLLFYAKQMKQHTLSDDFCST